MDAPLLSAGDFNQLRAFVAVASSLSFSRAAESLGVSSPALSQMVRALEEQVGVSLFNRTTRSVSLTDPGAQLLDRVRPAVEALAEALGETRERRADPAGIVRMHCFRAAADLYLTPILRAFSEAFPHVILDVTLDDAVVDIVAEGYDVAIRLGEVIDKDLIAVKLGPDLRQTAVAEVAPQVGIHGERQVVRGRCRRSLDLQPQGLWRASGGRRSRHRLRQPTADRASHPSGESRPAA
jgi:DNA-binding transcriptional LysR family regulator